MNLRLFSGRVGILDLPLGDDFLPLTLQTSEPDTWGSRVDEHLQVRRRACQIRRNLPTLHIFLHHDEPVQTIFFSMKDEVILIGGNRCLLVPGVFAIAGDE
jgi:hypothetical protein